MTKPRLHFITCWWWWARGCWCQWPSWWATPSPHYFKARSPMCRRWGGKTCLSIDDNNALGIGSCEKPELRAEDWGWMSHFVRDSSRYGPGLASGVMVQSKARCGDLNETNKSGCCFTPGCNLIFRLTSQQKRNSFIPNINLFFLLYC